MIKKSIILTDKENRWLRKKAYITGNPETVIIRTILDAEIEREKSGNENNNRAR